MKGTLSDEVKIYSGLVAAWVAAFIIFFVDHTQNGAIFPAGCGTVFMECGLETTAILSYFFSTKKPKIPELYPFVLMLCFFLPAEFSYMVVHYFKHRDNGLVTFFTTTFLYCISYSFGIAGFWSFMRSRIGSISQTHLLSLTWLPILFSFPVLFNILIPLIYSYCHKGGWNFLLFELVFNSFFAMAFFFFAVITMGHSVPRLYSFIALGGILTQLGNWGIYSGLLSGNRYTLTEYEFLWSCGIVTLWYSIVVIRKLPSIPKGIDVVNQAGDAVHQKQEDPIPKKYPRSLILQQRRIVIGLISATLIAAVAFLPKNLWTYRIAFFGVGVGCFVSLLLSEILAKTVIYYSSLFGKIIKNSAISENLKTEKSEIPFELWQIYQSAFHNEMLHHRVNVALGESIKNLASQVAHDIRSPLAALENVAERVTTLPEEDRILVRIAVNRITDIANHLIENRVSSSSGVSETPAVHLLSSLIEPLITEKRMQFRTKIGIEIDGRMDALSYGLFAKIQPTIFKRALSNLIDNAAEALGERGFVRFSLAKDGAKISNSIAIVITDNGKGILDEILPKLGKRGETFGKQGGSGLGLYYAKTSIESWGGTLELSSKIHFGTQVRITLPCAHPPSWFVQEIKLSANTPVVVLDDDPSIHQIWSRRLESVQHLSTPQQLRDWIQGNPAAAQTALYLMDYELQGFQETGLSLIEEYHLQQRSILVTSRFEEPKILAACQRLRVRLIPKGMAGFVPIHKSSR